MNKIHKNSYFSGSMGIGSYISHDSALCGKIGKFSSIGPFVHLGYGTHPITEPFATTSPAFFSVNAQNGSTFVSKQYFQEYKYADKEEKYAIIIGNDCWVGHSAFIVGGITIGDGAIILAHAVVTKNVPPYAIVGGVPAKILKYRYNEETINFLLNFKWWDKNVDWLEKNTNLLRNISDLKKYNKN
jgi:acetyltransferase-like isoleucine patch superfamily enzyme